MIRVYNTLSEKKEILKKPARGQSLKFFVCGPTVYDLSHIGHAKTYISFDVIARYLRFKKFPLFYLQNITDIDDRIIERARQEKKPALELARQLEKEYLQDMKTLGVASVDQYARASDFIDAIQKQIQTLLNKKFAYKIDSGIYFEIKKFPRYGQFSKQSITELRAGWRIEPDPQKKDPVDFALWKFSDEKPNWPSPWGDGRPGWHIEDTAITESVFGSQYDLHGGGIDLKFPHHESEIAQQESASEKVPFVKIWLHTGFLSINGEKMSKSLGNFITIRDFLKKWPSLNLRFLITSNHYRSPLNYIEELAKQTKSAIDNLREFLAKLDLVKKYRGRATDTQMGANDASFLMKKTRKEFIEAMNDDFNTPEALATIFSLINGLNPKIWNLTKSEAGKIKKLIIKLLEILGLEIEPIAIPKEIIKLAKKREKFRQKKNFSEADEIRSKINELGYKVEDTSLGPLIQKITNPF